MFPYNADKNVNPGKYCKDSQHKDVEREENLADDCL